MREVIPIKAEDTTPSVRAVLKAQGIDDAAAATERVARLAEASIRLYGELSRPVALVMDINRDDFESVYRGEGLNEDTTPLALAYREAGNLALYAVTLGPEISVRISSLFEEQEFALGTMLDAAASEGAEMASECLVSGFRRRLEEDGRLDAACGVMPFSPGYCGWHISAQRALFAHLKPEEIGVTLGASHLMHPLKSISGVMIAAPKSAFSFSDDFPFCATCRSRACRDRIQAILRQTPQAQMQRSE